jgi:DNA-binding transcriptional LysR family regulator
MDVLLRAVDRGGFAGAARDLGVSPSALSKVVAKLEARLGV